MLALCYAFFLWIHIITLQVSKSANGDHVAKLVRVDHLDRNYRLTVDGRIVYSSPDFSPRKDLAFREALAWDVTGNIIVLEVAKQRLFGYDAAKRKALADEELLGLALQPEPPLGEYYFEGEWPGLGRVRKQ